MTEHQIQRGILDYLPYVDVFSWRNNAGRVTVGEGEGKRMIILGKAGLPDIVGVLGKAYNLYYGRLFGIEVKRPNKEPTELQRNMLTELYNHGAVVMVAHSVTEVETFLKNLKQGGSYVLHL